ncbi:hypothetical protein QJS10_CPA16g01803 [Acorus calamus]|uniref:Chlororespiratory reduction31 n=1 Tax=Acorus calamus TaxID=4465 RepID=A0AAV9CZE2_ACOCL|nr:hypothetical protein QJS10_CPA16g01803 [Acorus calamus]
MASSFLPVSVRNPLENQWRNSLGSKTKVTHLFNPPKTPTLRPSSASPRPCAAKFDLFQIMGGRGLCSGEEGLLKELQRPPLEKDPALEPADSASEDGSPSSLDDVGEGAFDKELMGLTGGFPGGEKGLQRFIERNPPPKKAGSASTATGLSMTKPKPPELPLLMPGMVVIVKEPSNPFYMYCGIVQRVTDGKAGVLFEGGNWDKLISFRLNELERREKGPPMVNPKSAILESIVEK